MFKNVFKNFKSHCMTGISYMIPVIVIGGLYGNCSFMWKC